MLSKSHLFSGGIGLALGGLLSACLINGEEPKVAEVQPPVVAEVTSAIEAKAEPTQPEEEPSTSKGIDVFYALRAISTDCGSIELYFSKKDEIALELGENLFISPAVEEVRIYSPWSNDRMVLFGKFKPETVYTVTIKEGTETTDKSATLLQEAVLQVKTPALSPEVDFVVWRGQMELHEESVLPYRYTACKELKVKVWRAFTNNLVTYGQTTWNDDLLEFWNETSLTVPFDKTREQEALLPIYSLVKGKPGAYRFQISIDNESSDECYVILSNIGASYVYDRRQTPIVSLQHLLTGAPLANAHVALYDAKHQCIAMGISNAEGIAKTVPTPEAVARASEVVPARIVVTAGDDVTLLECTNRTRHQAYLPTLRTVPTYPTYLWPNRDGIHPGEEVQLYGLIRTATLSAAKGLPLTLELSSPEGVLITTAEVRSNEDGYFTAPFTLPKEGKSGYYTVKVRFEQEVLDTTALYVSDFTPNHVKLEVAFEKNTSQTLLVTAETYYGTPVAEGSGFYSLSADEAPLPEAWKGWTVGTNEGSRELSSNAFKKESEEATFRLEGVDPEIAKAFYTPVRIRAHLNFHEPNSRSVSASTFIDQSYYPAYLGMRYDEATQRVEFKQLPIEGQRVSENVISDFVLEEHLCTYELVKDNDQWRYSWVTTTRPVSLAPTLSTPLSIHEGIAWLSLNDLRPGQYTLSAQLGEVRTALTFWHNTSTLGKRLGHPSTLIFTTDKASYHAGETAVISFNAPVDGRLLITTGDTIVREHRSIEVTKGMVNLPIQIPATCTHGRWYVGVTLIAKDLNREGRYFGLAPLKINHAHRALALEVDLPATARPNETVMLKLKVTDHQGQPRRGTVALFAVDASILDVTAFKTPDPYHALFQRDGQTFTFGDIYSTLLPKLKIGPDGKIGGDKALAKDAQRTANNDDSLTKATTVITLPLQSIDATGCLTVPVTLPDFTGSLRFMAVVANAKEVGATAKTLVVRQPVTLTATGNRYGCANDRAMCTLRVINHDLPTQPYSLTMGGQKFEGTLATGETVYHSLLLSPGESVATLTMGAFSTSLTHRILLQDEIPQQEIVTIHRLNEGESLPEGAELLPTLASARAIALDWLAAYPYQCTEQLSAKLLPYASSQDPAERALVKERFAALMPRLTSMGYFTLWEEGSMMHPIATLVASHVLIEGSNAGILPQDALPRLLKVLYLMATSTEVDDRGEAAYAAFLLGEAGAKAQALHAARNLLITDETDAAAFVAAATLVFNGAADEGAPKMKAFLAKTTRACALIPSYMDDATTQAIVLAFALRAGVCSDEEAQQRLSTLLNTPWTTPQANAWAARALAACERLPAGQYYRQRSQTNLLRAQAPLRIKKRLLNLEGQPVTTLNHGDLAFVEITMELPVDCYDLVIRDRLPGGLEYEDAHLATRESIVPPAWHHNTFDAVSQENLGSELRFFGDAYEGSTTLLYPVRAATRGTFAIPAAVVEAMYDTTLYGGDDPTASLSIQ